MFFLFKTSFSFKSALFNNEIQNINSFFVHDTNKYENKICNFGKVMAIVAICLAVFRLQNIENKSTVLYGTIFFDLTGIFLSYIMNTNALVYILPLILCEVWVVQNIII
jgi:hypothetical protein